ncbi:MAG: hypothetical protein CMM52_02275 [Rhodospirillaceae bacterium]|nr:hypothetical protein [Rhodospirillaceae bacterium]
MAGFLPTRGLGLILSSGNRTVEPYFRHYAPENMAVFTTRMRMGAGGGRSMEEIANDAIEAARLLSDAKVDVICLQGTGIMIERGPSGEAELIADICKATATPTFTAAQAVVEAVRALSLDRMVMVHPLGEKPMARERNYLESLGVNVVHAAGRGGREQSAAIPSNVWADLAIENDREDAEGFFLSGSNTTMTEAVESIELKTGKPVVTSVQASLWAGVRRVLGINNAYETPPSMLGRLLTIT